MQSSGALLLPKGVWTPGNAQRDAVKRLCWASGVSPALHSPNPCQDLLGHLVWHQSWSKAWGQEAPARSSVPSPDLGKDHMVAAA